MYRYTIVLLWALLCMPSSAFAAFADRFNVSYLHLGNGLPSNFVDDVYQDDRGFIWVATHGGGLVRYDGYTYLYMGSGHAGMAVKSNYCRNISEDRHRRLWVSFDEYTDVIDLQTMGQSMPRGATGELDQKLRSILKERSMRVSGDRQGNIWIATRDHIYVLGFDDKGTVQSIGQLDFHHLAPDIPLRDIEGIGMLTAYGRRVRRLAARRSARGIYVLRETAMPPTVTCPRDVLVFDIMRKGRQLWFATNEGLYVSDRGLKAYRHTGDARSLSHDFVSTLALAPDGSVLAGTLAGVNIIRHGQIERWTAQSASGPLGSNFVNCIWSAHGMVWVGTESGGITKLSTRQLHLRNFVHGADPTTISPNAVNAIYPEENGRLWIGTVEGGLNRLDPGTQVFTHFTTANSGLSHNSVSAFAADGQGRLWIGTWGGGLNYVDMPTGTTVKPLVLSPSQASLLNFIGALAYDPYNHALWIGSNDGIFVYDLSTGRLREPFARCREINGCIGSLIDRDGILWMGCLDGVVKVNLRQRRRGEFVYRQLRYKLDAPGSGIIDKITCFCQTADGTIWLGSSGYGLYRRVVGKDGKETFKCYTVSDGLTNNSVRGMAETRRGALWIATEQGLLLFNPETGIFANYDEKDGLVSSQFYYNGAVSTCDGKLVLGSSKGLTIVDAFDPQSLYKGRLSFTQLWVNGRQEWGGSRFLDKDIASASEVNVREGDKSFVIEFSSLNYLNDRQGLYSYRMKGYDNKWTTLQPGEHSVKYTSLPPGSYHFEVRYVATPGHETFQEIGLEVNVSPYFWKSRWFVSAMLLLVVLMAVAMYRRRMEMTKRQERERILAPIEKALAESDTPQLLQKRIEAIMNNQRRYASSREKVMEADREESLQRQRPFMERVMEVMEQNYGNPEFGVTEMSELLNMNKAALSKSLNAEIGLSTNQFIRNYRLEIAKKFISENVANRNITEIAYRVGFNDPKYFTRCFTKLYGIAPSAYKADR